MGDSTGQGYPQERPAREVSVHAFQAGKYAVTVAEYFRFIADMGAEFDELWCDFINPCFILKQSRKYRIREGCENYPMIQVSYVGAVAYANWLSREQGLERVYKLEGLDSDLSKNGFRLLTEAEWEFACGGPRQLIHGYANHFDPDRVCHRHYSGEYRHLCASNNRLGGFGVPECSPLPVGTLPPNDFGLHEMLGNVNEWCHDRYADYRPGSLTNPSGPAHGSFRAIRGGCFQDQEDKLRKSYRHGIHYQSKCMIDGFRLARNL